MERERGVMLYRSCGPRRSIVALRAETSRNKIRTWDDNFLFEGKWKEKTG